MEIEEFVDFEKAKNTVFNKLLAMDKNGAFSKGLEDDAIGEFTSIIGMLQEAVRKETEQGAREDVFLTFILFLLAILKKEYEIKVTGEIKD